MLQSFFKSKRTNSQTEELNRILSKTAPVTSAELENDITIWRLASFRERSAALEPLVVEDELSRLVSPKLDSLKVRLAQFANNRGPDLTLERDRKLRFSRWLVCSNASGNVFLDKIRDSEDVRAFHDQPWPSLTVVLIGSIIEHRADASPRKYDSGQGFFRTSTAPHRIELIRGDDGKLVTAWLLVVTGAQEREWGYYCPRGWKQWKHYEAQGGCG